MSIVTHDWNPICMFKNVRHYVYGLYLEKEHHIRNSNKKPLRGPGYRSVNAVKFHYNWVEILNFELV
jgi:hypothetical protein